ncbi:Bidirectional sugar transporter SWEET4 [Linum grandiflorum]
MSSLETARTAVGIMGNVISLCLFLSPVPTFVKIWKKGSVERFKPDPYLATLMNCMVWVVYGLPMVHPDSTLVLTINGTGTFIQFVYIALFVVYSDKKKRVKVLSILLIEIAFVVALLLIVTLLVHSVNKRGTIVGVLCVVFCIMIYVAPLSVMKMVIKTKSVEYMPFYLSLASLANGACWTAYALIKIDWFIIIPNGVGALLAMGQLILYAAFYKSTQRQIAERKAAEKGGSGGGELNLSQVGVAVVDRDEDAYVNKAARNGAV